MSDPLSVAAGVAGLVSLGLQSTEYLYKYYNTCRHQHQDLVQITDQLGGLLESLQIVDEVVRNRKWRSDEQRIIQSIEKAITRSKDIIHTLKDEVDKFKKEPAGDWKKKAVLIGRRAAYPFKRSTLEDLGEDVNEFRDNLSFALQALQLKQHQNTQNDIEELKQIVERARAQNVASNLHQWLKAPDASIDYNNASQKRHAATGQWFVQSSTFKDWLQHDNSFLWLYGFAGCGKSILCSTAIQHAFRHQQAHINSAVAFFFFTFDDDSKQDASAALRALLLQLAGQIPDFAAELTRLQNVSNTSIPPMLTLIEYLRNVITRCRAVYVLLDALDESPEETSRAEVLSMIETIREWRLPGLHLLVTSRDAPDIRIFVEAQQDVPHAEWVPMKNDSVDLDILDYVSYEVDHDRQLRRWNDVQRQQIKDYLSQHAEGVFRWVNCQLDPLKRCPRSAKHLERCLRGLPQTLDKTYERMLCSIGDESRDDAQRLLSLLCYSLRPLTVGELIEALAIDVDDQERYDQDRRFSDADDLLRICPGLIEINPVILEDDESSIDGNYYVPFKYEGAGDKVKIVDTTANEDKNGGKHQSEDGSGYESNATGDKYEDNVGATLDQTVRIGHFSVQEYLVSDRIKQSAAADYALSGPAQHARIFKACLIYLSEERFLIQAFTPQLIKELLFAEYAARYWSDHYRQADQRLVEPLSEKIALLLLKKNVLEYWIRLWNPDEQWRGVDYRWSFSASAPTYYAAYLGLDNILKKLLDHGADVNGTGVFSFPAIAVASREGRERAVQILLDAGADVNAFGTDSDTALIAASQHGRMKMVQKLLNAGAEVNSVARDYGTALIAASICGHTKIVQMLLDAGAKVNTIALDHGTALIAASTYGHTKVVQMLLDAGADHDVVVGVFSTALLAASRHSYEDIVQMLLNAGPNVNLTHVNDYSGTALTTASAVGNVKIVQMLLDAGIKVDVLGGKHGYALTAASRNGHTEVVHMLLDAGADVNAKGGRSGSALEIALIAPHEHIVKILLHVGADIDAIEDDNAKAKLAELMSREVDGKEASLEQPI